MKQRYLPSNDIRKKVKTMVNKHGLPMRGLKKACGKTKPLYPYSGFEVIIYYDRKTGYVGSIFELARTRIEYDDSEIWVCDAEWPMTMQEIADRIWERLSEVERDEQLYRNYEAYFSDLA